MSLKFWLPITNTQLSTARNLSKELPAFQNEIAIKHKLASSSSSNSSNNELLHSSGGGGMSDHHSARMMECYPPPIPCQPLPMPTPINPVRIPKVNNSLSYFSFTSDLFPVELLHLCNVCVMLFIVRTINQNVQLTLRTVQYTPWCWGWVIVSIFSNS